MLDLDALADQTGRPVRTDYHSADRLPRADAVIAAPATYNTINTWAAGIADTYPLTLLAELTGIALPIVVLPFVNSALAANRVFTRNIEDLQTAGVQVLFGPGQFEPLGASPWTPWDACSDEGATWPPPSGWRSENDAGKELVCTLFGQRVAEIIGYAWPAPVTSPR